jgi:hypothetical protein
MARKLASAHGLGDHEVIVARADLEAVQDRIALLRQALLDVEREPARGEITDLSLAFDWIRSHASEVAALRLEPASGPMPPEHGR